MPFGSVGQDVSFQQCSRSTHIHIPVKIVSIPKPFEGEHFSPIFANGKM